MSIPNIIMLINFITLIFIKCIAKFGRNDSRNSFKSNLSSPIIKFNVLPSSISITCFISNSIILNISRFFIFCVAITGIPIHTLYFSICDLYLKIISYAGHLPINLSQQSLVTALRVSFNQHIFL